MDFKKASLISNYLSKEYAGRIFSLLVAYKDISASEAASRLNMHIRPIQDFLDVMSKYKILEKVEVNEGKRPYFRYELIKRKIEICIDLDNIASNEIENQTLIRESHHSNSKFTVARGGGEYFSSITLWTGQGRSIKERKINLTNAQGKFLFHLPFPDAKPLSISEIFELSGVVDDYEEEILNLIKELIQLKVIDEL